MDYDEITNLTNNSSTPIEPSSSSTFIVHEIVFTLFAIAAITANILIIFITLRFKRMRTAPYMFIASWALTDLFSLVLLPSGLRLMSVMEDVPLPEELFCVFYQTGSIMHGGTILSVTFVAIDWVMAAYFCRASGRFRKCYKLVLAILWTSILSIAISASVYCTTMMFHFILPLFFLIATLALAFLVITVIHIVRLVQKIRKRSSEYSGLAINLATVFLGCWTLNMICIMLFHDGYFSPTVLMISFCLIYSSAIINFFLMFRFNNDFSACVRQVFSCKRIKYEEDLTDGVSIQTNVNADSVRIDFGTSTILEKISNERRIEV